MLEEDYDAVLHHWTAVGYPSPDDDGVVIIGQIAKDRKGRFAEGTWIMTSMLLSSIDDAVEGAVVRTLNSTYLLGEPFKLSAGWRRLIQ